MTEVLNDENIKVFLENAPIYSWREFIKPPSNRSGLMIKEIDAFCEICGQHRPFHNYQTYNSGGTHNIKPMESGTSYFEFSCVSCRKSHREFLVEHVVNDKTIKLQKYGELPRAKIHRSPTLQKFLKDDLDNYEKAIVCLSHEYGVAAFAYFRRIVENNINSLLDLLQSDVQSSGSESSIIKALNNLRTESSMSEKIKIANLALPSHLNPDGLNPLGRLYKVLSEGVHNLTDAECLQQAKITSECLEYLVSELASRAKHREHFKSAVGKL